MTPHMKMRRVSWTVPVLSAQLMTAPTGRPSEMRNLAPDEPPRPKRRQEQSNPSVFRTPPLCERDSDPSNLNLTITGHNEDRDIQSPCLFADTDVTRVKISSLTVLSFAEKKCPENSSSLKVDFTSDHAGRSIQTSVKPKNSVDIWTAVQMLLQLAVFKGGQTLTDRILFSRQW